jgi:hypothetical protein
MPIDMRHHTTTIHSIGRKRSRMANGRNIGFCMDLVMSPERIRIVGRGLRHVNTSTSKIALRS